MAHLTLRTKSRISFCVNTPEAVRITVESKRFQVMEKFYSSKTLLKLGRGKMHPPHPPHGSATDPKAFCFTLLKRKR